MIKLSSLRKSDIGRAVTYFSCGGDKIEQGIITSWNDNFIFVRYALQLKPEVRARFGQTSEATSPEDLEWGDGAARMASIANS